MPAVIQAQTDVDALIVSIHIGLMYIDYPRPQHKAMAERLMAAGADLILMHHAHVLQGVQAAS
jgi:poly-gamma-glutamate synthesis protein (capsule biosynthesis protein)